MTVDDAMLMAFADGELDPTTRKRVERAMADDPAIAERVAAFETLTGRVRGAFDPIALAPVPDGLVAMLKSNVVAIAPKPATRPLSAGLALAASLLLGIGLGTRLGTHSDAPFAVRDGKVIATGALAHALDSQVASASGDIRILVTFRGPSGYCRVFAAAVADGIACRNRDKWKLLQTRSASAAPASAYRQTSSPDAALMAAAQDMMIGAPLDATSEARARAAGWR